MVRMPKDRHGGGVGWVGSRRLLGCRWGSGARGGGWRTPRRVCMSGGVLGSGERPGQGSGPWGASWRGGVVGEGDPRRGAARDRDARDGGRSGSALGAPRTSSAGSRARHPEFAFFGPPAGRSAAGLEGAREARPRAAPFYLRGARRHRRPGLRLRIPAAPLAPQPRPGPLSRPPGPRPPPAPLLPFHPLTAAAAPPPRIRQPIRSL